MNPISSYLRHLIVSVIVMLLAKYKFPLDGAAPFADAFALSILGTITWAAVKYAPNLAKAIGLLALFFLPVFSSLVSSCVLCLVVLCLVSCTTYTTDTSTTDAKGHLVTTHAVTKTYDPAVTADVFQGAGKLKQLIKGDK